MAASPSSPATPSGADGELGLEPRVVWVNKHIRSHYGRDLPSDRLRKLFAQESYMNTVTEFLDNADVPLMLSLRSGSSVSVTLDMPKRVKPNTVYFLKLGGGRVEADSLPQQVLVGDLHDLLGSLAQVTEHVYLPLLANPKNQAGWSEVVTKEVLDALHGYLAKVQMTVGEVAGTTHLPMPTSVDPRTVNNHKDRVHLLEGCIVTWTGQIKAVLKQDPEKLLAAGGHPGPLVELDFWEAKAHKLSSMYQQLQTDAVRRVLRYLDSSKSTYTIPFASLCRDLFHARTEAVDNCKYLAPLREWFERIETEVPLPELEGLFKPIMRLVLLVWKHSRFYNTPSRLVVLVREVCNTIVRQALSFVNGPTLFDLVEEQSSGEAVNMLKTTLRVCGVFKTSFFDAKAKSLEETPNNTWRVQNSAIFGRLDNFLERCHDMKDFANTVVQFSLLANIEVGGTKGKTLTNSVHQIHSDFQTAVARFQSVKYDVMDVDCKGFDDDFYEFRVRVKELERRLASVLTQAFDDMPTIGGRFKLLDSFTGLLHRNSVRDELERKHHALLAAYSADLAEVQRMFNEGKARPPIAHNLPPIAGALSWCRGLRERVSMPMRKLKALDRAILSREDAKEIVKVYTGLVAALAEFEHTKIEEWGRHIEHSSQEKLKLPLLRTQRARPNLLSVNFDPALVRLLREVKYFLLLGLRVPDSALEIYKRAETFRKHTGNLDLIVNMHNAIQMQLLPVERPLMQQYLNRMRQALAPGLKSLNWKSHGTDLFITESMNTVRHAKDLLDKMTDNLKKIQDTLDGWAEEPMITRRAKPLKAEAFETNVQASTQQRYTLVTEGGRLIGRLLKDTNRHLRVSQGMPDWRAYVDFVSNIVISGLMAAVQHSLTYLSTQLDAVSMQREQRPPVIEIELDLYGGRNVLFVPDIGHTQSNDGVRDRVLGWVEAIFRVSTLFGRLDDGNHGFYAREVSGDPGVQMLLASITSHMEDAEAQAHELGDSYKRFSHLYTTDLNDMFADFTKHAHRVPIEPYPADELEDLEDPEVVAKVEAWNAAREADLVAREAAGDIAPFVGATERVLDLAAFDARICELRDVMTDIGRTRASVDLSFIRINAQPIKQALATCVTKWIYMFTSYLQEHVVGSLQWLADFMARTRAGLREDVTADPGERQALMDVITHIRDVRRVMDRTQAMFSPLRETVHLLTKHGASFLDATVDDVPVLTYLEQAQLKWDNVLNQTFKVKEAIRPHQNQMADNIKSDIARFKSSVRSFRLDFSAKAPFRAAQGADAAYTLLDKYESSLCGLETKAANFAELEELFELARSKHEEIRDTREEMVLLKRAWDMHELVQGRIATWRLQLWANIDAEELLDETRRLQAQLRAQPAKLRSWNVSSQVDSTLRNLAVVLPLVVDLHSPAMQDRHWKRLNGVTGSMVDKGPDFCLDDVLNMHLHRHVADVMELVEVAAKELKIDKKLTSVEEAWRKFELVLEPYKDVEMKVLVSPSEIIETLEEHMLQLQTMSGMGKFVEYFRSRVTSWQEKLGIVETTLALWVAVQGKWTALESIFLGSQDIRSQLPEDSKRFEAIDQDFKDLMREVEVDTNVVGACTIDGRADRLRSMVVALERCEKALNEYLDVKKNIFPRFFFVANTALLHILSNGNSPPAIMPHLGDCFDAISNLRLVANPKDVAERQKLERARQKQRSSAGGGGSDDDDDDSNALPPLPLDTGTSMIAKDGEVVELPFPFIMQGAVERWLNQLVTVMQTTLKQELDGALDAAASWDTEMPREQWVYAFPAQIVLLASQVYWTEESESALEDFESGQEDATRKYLETCINRLEALIRQVLTPLDRHLRTKIISLITIDVHARDVVQRLVDERTGSPGEFLWQQQLRYYWHEEEKDCVIRICDFRSWYCYEYIGNTGRLVITPLTDRCYITLTMAMRLMLGGAPAGPAGTGKTETTKDLARGLGLPCYVFNCSDQMNYQTMADIFKGLAQTGAWGCFDEFNRIPIEVLSVVATQVETVLSAIRWLSLRANRPKEYRDLPDGRPPARVGQFEFMGDTLNLVPTVGFFITMNPGYAGRTELPENLKALFRSCAMIRPDLALICENMLMSEGFVAARPLSVKFVTLYSLSSELLSKQPHYDWGLRAVKAVLRVAGKLRREELKQEEDAVLMRALRDFNTPKIVTRDIPIFLRLVDDLFPGVELDPKVNAELRATCSAVCRETGLQPEDVFLLKVEQLAELLEIRHSVMLVGPAGTGKSTVWRTLARCVNHDAAAAEDAAAKEAGKEPPMGHKPVCVFETVNPKAVTSDELYGYMTLAKDWKDGVLSIIMRNMAKNWAPFTPRQTSKWVVLDGDIDAEWIESMNTVMDDNKVLTLVSNERIPLSDPMRMVFEIQDLANATPATVSRAGILYINPADIGWKPLVDSWIAERTEATEVALLPNLFRKYVEPALGIVKENKLATVSPVETVCVVSSICHLLEGLLGPPGAGDSSGSGRRGGGGDDSGGGDGGAEAGAGGGSGSGSGATGSAAGSQEFLEHQFVFAVIWAVGGALAVDAQLDSRKKFSDAWKSTFKGPVKFPPTGSVFDYFFADRTTSAGDGAVAESVEVVPWSEEVPGFTPVAESAFANIVVPTVDTVRLSRLLHLGVATRWPVLLVGPSGTGKTALVREYFSTEPVEGLLNSVVNLNFYTDASALQRQLEEHIDKRSGRIFGPPGNKRHCFYVDDLNMPQVETYGTQTPIALLRQFLDYASWYDRDNLGLKREVQDVQVVAAMNPKAGSFSVSRRLARHFVTLAVQMPSPQDLSTIYASIISAHLATGFSNAVVKLAQPLVDASISLLNSMMIHFLPSAVKFHYNFNMRDMANLFQGLCSATPFKFAKPLTMVRLWIHEAERVFEDRLINDKDLERFRNILAEASKKHFEEEPEAMQAKPLLFTPFKVSLTQSRGVNMDVDDEVYAPVVSTEALHATLTARLREYNEHNSAMDLVLFDQAMQHVTRIARIISNPRGNALLVGVGGSGKQSLCRLAAFLRGYSVFQPSVAGSFGIPELKEALKDLYRKAGVKPGLPLVFLLTDAQIVDERFLVYVNDLLSSGVIPELFTPDELDGLLSGLRLEAKAAGVTESRPEMMRFFVERVRRNLHIVLCFSPVGKTFRVRARKFPALINCTCIDWFHPWPVDALVSVAVTFLADVSLGNEDVRENISHHMAEVHTQASTASKLFRSATRRHNYTTPKSFLEFIALYKRLLAERRADVAAKVARLETGLTTLRRTSEDVKVLQQELAGTLVRVEEKKVATDELLEKMGRERGEAEQQQEVASAEKEKAATAAKEASAIEAEAAGELAVAKPALDDANEAVNCLNKASLTELKSMSKPPAGVDRVTKAVLMMIRGEKRNFSWDNAKKMMAKVDAFKTQLERYDGANMAEDLVARLEPVLADPDFNGEAMLSKSFAAANLCNWVVNIVKYHKIYRKVAPLMARLEAARERKAAADAAVAEVEAMVAEVEGRLHELQQAFLEATNAKAKVEAEAASCQARLGLAKRLVDGLASENVRWGNEIQGLRASEETLVGDLLLASAFVSYVGAFDATFRRRLWFDEWAPDVISREIPMTEEADPLGILATDAETAEWMNEGLPSDRKSLENGAVTLNSSRWPVLIDPQLQGIKWVRQREAAAAQREAVAAARARVAQAAQGRRGSTASTLQSEGKGDDGEGSEMDAEAAADAAAAAAAEAAGEGLVVVRLSQQGWMREILAAIPNGTPVLLENVDEEVDAALDPLLGRAYVRTGKTLLLRMGGEEVEVDPRFRLYIQTKLANPHFKPELQAQCTLVNFMVTKGGLEEQLLAHVVSQEQPALEKDMRELQQSFNQYKIQLMDLENQLLTRLANAPADILSDVALIEGLEATKVKVTEINLAVERGKETEEIISESREVYRPVAAEAALLYFQTIQLYIIKHMYQYSLDAFVKFFFKAMSLAPPVEEEELRVKVLQEAIRLTIYTWVSRGLFEEHKLILMAQLTFELLKNGVVGEDSGFDPELLAYLVRGPTIGDDESPVDWLPATAWSAVRDLATLDAFGGLDTDLENNAPRFLEWYNHVTPEEEKLPLEWRELNKRPFQKLLVVRCLRPDRMPIALTNFIAATLPSGDSFTECDAQLNPYQVLEDSFSDSSPDTPIYFILSPGADIVSDVDRLARKYGMEKGVSYHNISLGQGQDVVAMEALKTATTIGHWVLLNNVHLMPRWLHDLEKALDAIALAGSVHSNFRLMLSSDPSDAIPVGLLSRSIKLTNEPPSGLKANLKRAFASFSAEEVEEMDTRTRGVLFGLCHFHALMIERKKFGPKGFNMMYPFAAGDLLASAVVLRNYMENAAGTPWADLRYLFGQIMYGGHIVNDFDRLLCVTYLDYFMRNELMDEMELFPYLDEGTKYSFKAPTPTTYKRYLEHINTALTTETPLAFGLHPNAEIGFRTDMARTLFATIQDLQPKDAGSGDAGQSVQHVAGSRMQDLLEEYRECAFDIGNIRGLMDEPGPFQTVYVQECEAMNALTDEMGRTLAELELGLKGELTMSPAMESLMHALYADRVPVLWEKLAYPSLRGLGSWLVNLAARRQMLQDWADAPMEAAKVVWLGGFFNPQSFLTSIMQSAAQRTGQELDKLTIVTDVTKYRADEIEHASRDGVYVTGLFLEGARWDETGAVLESSRPKEMYCGMPVINCKSSLPPKEGRGQQPARVPVYKTQQRGPTYVFTAQLKTKAVPQKWILAGVVLVMEVV